MKVYAAKINVTVPTIQSVMLAEEIYTYNTILQSPILIFVEPKNLEEKDGQTRVRRSVSA